MAQVGVRALKQNASAVVADAAAGAEVTITDRGRPVARLVPLAPRRLDDLIRSGRARPARRPWSALPPPARRARGRPALSSVLDELRDDERY